MERFAAFFARHRFVIALFVATLTACAGYGLVHLEVDDHPRSIFRTEDETYERLEEVFRDFGSDDNDCIVVVDADDVFAPEVIAALRRLAAAIRAVDGIEEVVGPQDVLQFAGGILPIPILPSNGAPKSAFAAARRIALEHPLIGGRLISNDGTIALLIARIEREILSISSIRTVVDDVQAVIEEVARSAPVRVRLTGVPPIRSVIFDTIEREQRSFGLIGALFGLLIGTLIFMRPGPVLITSCASILAAIWATGGLGLVGEPINLLNSQVPLLILVIAFTDAVHLMVDVLHQRREGVPALTASREAIRHLGPACALTSFTTAVGFGSLALSRVEIIQRFGLIFATAVGLAFVAVVTVVPLLTSFGLRATARAGFEGRWDFLRAPAERLIRAVLGHARLVAALGLIVTIGLLLISLRLVPDNRLTEATPHDHESVQALRDCEEHFGGVLNVAVLCEWPASIDVGSDELARVCSEVTEVLDAHPFTVSPLSPLDLLSLIPTSAGPRSLASLAALPPALVQRHLRVDLRRALITSQVPDAGASEAEPAYEQLEAALGEIRERHPEFKIELTGTGYVARRNVNLIIIDFAKSLFFAALVIFGALTVAFRSVRLGAISVFPNVFPLVVAAASLVLFDKDLQVVSAVAFTVCLGIAVDDTIHFVSRFRRELSICGDVEEALVRAFVRIGGALLVTTAVLFGGFGVLAFSSLPTTRLFAAITCTGLVAALVGDLLLLPALLSLFVRPKGPSGN